MGAKARGVLRGLSPRSSGSGPLPFFGLGIIGTQSLLGARVVDWVEVQAGGLRSGDSGGIEA
jgi:hypothetical protein